jgi:putative peptidoglycan lipid II flippase
VATVPATIAFVVFSHPIVAVLYQRGAFTAADTDVVAFVQAMYVLQVPLYTLGILFVKVISAMGRNRIFVWGNLLSVSLNALLDYTLMKRWGAGGIALSTSIVYSVSCVVLGVFAWRQMPRQDTQEVGADGA